MSWHAKPVKLLERRASPAIADYLLRAGGCTAVLVYALELLDGWPLRALIIGGVASLIIAEKRSPWLEPRRATPPPAAGTRSSRDAPVRGLWHRVLVYLGLREDAELIAHWERFRPDTPATMIGFALGAGAIAATLAGVILIVRLVVN
jgi:hypothetical protein